MKKVLGTRLLCKEFEGDEPESQIVMPDTVQKTNTKFTVEAIGHEVEQCQVGDVVKILPRSEPQFQIDGFYVLDEAKVVLRERDE